MTETSHTDKDGSAKPLFKRDFNSKKVFRVMMVSLVVAAGYIGWFWYHLIYASPVEVYHRTWQTARDNYFDRESLREWTRFEHCFDSKIKTDADAVLYANKMLKTLGDPYTALHSKDELDRLARLQNEKFVGIGVFLEQVKSAFNGKRFLAVKGLMPDGPALRAGLKQGDKILSIDGHKGTDLTIEKLREIVGKRENQPTLVVVERGHSKLSLVLKPLTVIRKDVELKRSDRRVAHIVIRNFMKKNTADRAMALLEKTAHRQAVIIDLRNNPGGSVDECLKLATAFIDEGPLVTLKVRQVGSGHTLNSYIARRHCIELKKTDADGNVMERKELPRLRPIAAKRPLAILINEGSASASEMLAAALVDNKRAVTIGTRSFGKGVAQAGIPIANGTVLSVTCVHYLTPSGRFLGTGKAGYEGKKWPVNSEGINPDIPVTESPEDTAAYRDKPLAAALRLFECTRLKAPKEGTWRTTRLTKRRIGTTTF
jgi:carboxyl-terminal processing protease